MVRGKIKLPALHYLWVAYLFTAAFDGTSQGLLLDEDPDTRIAYREQGGNKSLQDEIKGIYKIDLKPYAPRPQHQGEILSCTGWAVGYAALSIMNAVKNHWRDSIEKIKENAFSALFIYNQIWKGNCAYSGSNIMDAGKLLVAKGDLPSKEFDRFKNRCDKLPGEEELKLAEKFKIQDFEKLFTREEPAIDKIYKTKLSLSRNLPVVAGISIKKNFKLLKSTDTYWNPTIGDTTFADQHAITVIGFDDGKGAFELMNSWGTDWANKGFVWIKYADFAEYTKLAYHFLPFNYLLGENEIELTVKMERPGYSGEGILQFSEVRTTVENNFFKSNEAISPGDQVRLTVYSSFKDVYLYCFSIDPKKNDSVHWPKNFTNEETLNQLNKYNSGALQNQLFIPDEFKALEFEYRGGEYLYILLSREKIPKFKESVIIFKNLSSMNKYDALKKAFGRNIIAPNKIKFNAYKIDIKSEKTEKMILPVIINLDII